MFKCNVHKIRTRLEKGHFDLEANDEIDQEGIEKDNCVKTSGGPIVFKRGLSLEWLTKIG